MVLPAGNSVENKIEIYQTRNSHKNEAAQIGCRKRNNQIDLSILLQEGNLFKSRITWKGHLLWIQLQVNGMQLTNWQTNNPPNICLKAN